MDGLAPAPAHEDNRLAQNARKRRSVRHRSAAHGHRGNRVPQRRGERRSRGRLYIPESGDAQQRHCHPSARHVGHDGGRAGDESRWKDHDAPSDHRDRRADAHHDAVEREHGTSTADVTVPMSLLLGDTTGNGMVNASDVGQTKAQSGQTVSAKTSEPTYWPMERSMPPTSGSSSRARARELARRNYAANGGSLHR